MASVRGLTPEAIKALIEDSKRDYKVVRESLTTMHRRYEAFDADLDHLSRRMDNLPDELQESLDSLVNLDAVLEEAKAEVDSLRRRFPIKEVDIADGAITANKIEAGSITTLQLAAGAVTAEKIAAGAVTAKKIHSKAVTAEKLAADSVTAGSIAADSILTRHIGTEQVTAEKLKAGAVEADKIAAGAVTADSIAAGAVTADSIEAGAFRLRPNSILPDAAFGNFPRKNATYRAKEPMPGLSEAVRGYRQIVIGDEYLPFARPIEMSTKGRYVIDADVYFPDRDDISRNLRLPTNGIGVALVIDDIYYEDLTAQATGTFDGESDSGRVTVDVRKDLSSIQGYKNRPVDTRIIQMYALKGARFKYDHTNIKIDLSFVASEGLRTIKVHGIYLSAKGAFTRFDILEYAPTMQDLEAAQRATQIHADNLSDSINQLNRNLTSANREIQRLRSKVVAPTSFMLTAPASPSKNGFSITTKEVGSEKRYVLVNNSRTSAAYSSTVAASHGTKLSDVVWSGVVQPGSFANIGPYVKNAPVSAFVDPDGESNTYGGTFDFAIVKSDYKDRGILPIYERDLVVIPSSDLYRRVSVSVDAVVPQVGSGGIATKTRTYLDYVVVDILPTYDAREKRESTNLVFHEQRAGSFGTQRYDVSYTMSYDGDIPSTRANTAGHYLLTVGVIASNSSGVLVGTKFKGGYTFYK